MSYSVASSITSCDGKASYRTLSDSQEEKKIFKTKVDLLNCRPEDVKLKMEGNRVIIEGKLKSKNKERPVHFSKHYIMPENCELEKMQYTITPNGVYITAPRREKEFCTDWPKLDENCTTNCVDLKDRFEIRLNVEEFRPEDIKIKVNGNTITIKAKHLLETGMRKVIKTYTLPENCEITKLERKFLSQGYLLLTIPKFLGLFYDAKKRNSIDERNQVKCKFNITSEKFEIKIDVSHYKPGDINVTQQKRMVTVEGKRFKKSEGIEEKFEKSFVLPSEYDITKVDRKFHADGVLVISVPRIEGKPMEDFRTHLPENAICDMQVKENWVEIKLNILGYSPEEIMIKITGNNTLTLEGKQLGVKGKVNKSFMKSYLLPSDCDSKKIKKYMTSNGILVVRIPRSKKTCSLENLSEVSDQKIFSSGAKNGSVDNLSEPEDNAMVDSAELDREKFEMKFNVEGFETDDIYVKINKNIVTIECRHPNPEKGIIKSYLVPKEFDLNALQTFITHDDVLVVTIPRFTNDLPKVEKHSQENDLTNDFDLDGHSSEKFENKYVIKVDIRGYNNNDISLDTQGQIVVVQGGHLGNELISRSFSKKFNVPLSYDVEKLVYYITVEGFLIIDVPKRTSDNVSPQLYTFPNDIETVSHKGSLENKHCEPPTIHRKQIRNDVDFYNDCNNKLNFNDNFTGPVKNFNEFKHQNKEKFSDMNGNLVDTNHDDGSIIIDDENKELFQIIVDVKNCREKDIDVRIKGHDLRVEGRREHIYHNDSNNTTTTFTRKFVVPEKFNMRGIRTELSGGFLIINIPKFDANEIKNTQATVEEPRRGKEIQSNVKIGRNETIVELDASGLKIEDIEINTHKNTLTIEISRGDSIIGNKFKTKVELPEDSIIDDITKCITEDEKLLVNVPRKIVDTSNVKPKENYNSNAIKNETLEFLRNEQSKSCLLRSKGEKSKSVKFMVNDFENESEESIKFATLPRNTTFKTYNGKNFEGCDPSEPKAEMEDEDFELRIFVPNHEPDEVVVKLRGSTVTIEGKKKNDKRHSYCSRNFFKTYIVPKYVDTTKLKTEFSDNYLIVTAPRLN